MGRVMTTEPSSAVDLADGTYVVEVGEVEDAELDGSRYGAGVRKGLKFFFLLPEVQQENGEPVQLTAIASAERLTPKTKLWNWVEALTGEQLTTGLSIDIDALVGRRALAAVANEPGEDGTRWARVKSLIALPKAPRPVIQPVALPVAEPSAAVVDRCACGGELDSYAPDGRPLCRVHADELDKASQ